MKLTRILPVGTVRPRWWGDVRHDASLRAVVIAPIGINVLLRLLWNLRCRIVILRPNRLEQLLTTARAQGIGYAWELKADEFARGVDEGRRIAAAEHAKAIRRLMAENHELKKWNKKLSSTKRRSKP